VLHASAGRERFRGARASAVPVKAPFWPTSPSIQSEPAEKFLASRQKSEHWRFNTEREIERIVQDFLFPSC
jgi:hypothetical protein